MNGRINSFQSMGAVDGPGIRYVIFLQGCPLRCVYCHNPETWKMDAGKEYSAEEVCNQVGRYRSYFGERGGVTVSGGEPLLQWQFTAELFEKLKKKGIHTALDTSGIGSLEGAGEVLKHTDLVLCDIKFSTETDYKKYCGGSLKEVQEFLTLTETMRIPLWIRHVTVPDLEDGRARALAVSEMAESYKNMARFEFLPFKKLCTAKYEAMGIPFPLSDHEECSSEFIEELYRMTETVKQYK